MNLVFDPACCQVTDDILYNNDDDNVLIERGQIM